MVKLLMYVGFMSNFISPQQPDFVVARKFVAQLKKKKNTGIGHGLSTWSLSVGEKICARISCDTGSGWSTRCSWNPCCNRGVMPVTWGISFNAEVFVCFNQLYDPRGSAMTNLVPNFNYSWNSKLIKHNVHNSDFKYTFLSS